MNLLRENRQLTSHHPQSDPKKKESPREEYSHADERIFRKSFSGWKQNSNLR